VAGPYHARTGSNSRCGYPDDGQYPHAPLSLVNGLMYGTTWTGGSRNCKIKHGPRLYGTTASGGAYGDGTVFALTP
jgi:uncharacterized repeat protein (TIGR03803 family)